MECNSKYNFLLTRFDTDNPCLRSLVSLTLALSSVIRQKGKSQNGRFKKTKHVKFSEIRIFLTPWYVSGGKKRTFFGKFGVLYFRETAVLRFALLPYYRPLTVLYLHSYLGCKLWRNSFLQLFQNSSAICWIRHHHFLEYRFGWLNSPGGSVTTLDFNVRRLFSDMRVGLFV